MLQVTAFPREVTRSLRLLFFLFVVLLVGSVLGAQTTLAFDEARMLPKHLVFA